MRQVAGPLGPLVPLVLAAALATAGCGSASAPSPPTGVDELVVPTSAPDPDDFADPADDRVNPWLPLAPGTTTTYDDRVVTVEAGPTHDGIATLARTTTPTGPTGDGTDAPVAVTDLVAEDDDGNLWWLGRDDQWFAEPGLLMPAEPRRGDGFVVADAPGLTVRARVVEVDDDQLVVEVTEVAGTTGDEAVQRETYARGTGLVGILTASGEEVSLLPE